MTRRRLFELNVLNAAERFTDAARGATASKRRLEGELTAAVEQYKRFRLTSGDHYMPGNDPDDVTGGNGDG
jgi:hypothetical protein